MTPRVQASHPFPPSCQPISRWTFSILFGVVIWLVWVVPSREGILDLPSEVAGVVLLIVLSIEGLWWSIGANLPIIGFMWGFVLVFLGAIPLLQITTQSFPLPIVFSSENLKNAVFVNVVFVIAFRLGSGRSLRSSNVHRIKPSAREYRRLVILSISLWFLAATAGFISFGLTWLFSTRTAAGVSFGDLGSNATVAAVIGFTQVVLAWGAVMGILAAKHYHRFGLNVLVTVMVLWTVIWINPLASARFVSWAVYGAIIMALVPSSWKRFDVLAMLVLPVFLVSVFPILGVTRNAESLDRGFQSEANYLLINGLAQSPDFDAFQMEVNAQKYVEDNGHALGRQLVGSAVIYIPRQSWPDKPLASGILVGRWFGFGNVNLSMPLPAEFWIDFGLLGVVAVGGALGLSLGAIGRSLVAWRREGEADALTAVWLLLLWFQLMILRGSLGAVSGRMIVLGILALLSMIVAYPRYSWKSDESGGGSRVTALPEEDQSSLGRADLL